MILIQISWKKFHALYYFWLEHHQKFMENLLSLLLGLSLLNDFDILIKKFQAFYYACRPPKFE